MGKGRNRTEGDDFVSARLNKQRDISYKRILNTLFDLASEINYFNSHNPVVSLRVIAYAPVVGRREIRRDVKTSTCGCQVCYETEF